MIQHVYSISVIEERTPEMKKRREKEESIMRTDALHFDEHEENTNSLSRRLGKYVHIRGNSRMY